MREKLFRRNKELVDKWEISLERVAIQPKAGMYSKTSLYNEFGSAFYWQRKMGCVNNVTVAASFLLRA